MKYAERKTGKYCMKMKQEQEQLEEVIPIRWTRRVDRLTILRLYEHVSKGIYDEELIDEILYSFIARLSELRHIARNEFTCPECNSISTCQPPGNLLCSQCGWTIAWQEYFRSYQGRQLSAEPGLIDELFDRYITQLHTSTSPRDKMAIIDGIIHECHKGMKVGGKQLYTRPVAVNLIEGTLNEILNFVENLPDCPDNPLALIEWRKKCMSSIIAAHEEESRITRLIDGMPRSLVGQVQELIMENKNQQAIRLLQKYPQYDFPLLGGNRSVSYKIVKVIKKKFREGPNARAEKKG